MHVATGVWWKSKVSWEDVSKGRHFKSAFKIEEAATVAMKIISFKVFQECFQQLFSLAEMHGGRREILWRWLIINDLWIISIRKVSLWTIWSYPNSTFNKYYCIYILSKDSLCNKQFFFFIILKLPTRIKHSRSNIHKM